MITSRSWSLDMTEVDRTTLFENHKKKSHLVISKPFILRKSETIVNIERIDS